MPKATVTTRDLKNLETGIDVSIPSQKLVSGRLGKSLEYEVVVITNLECFKTRQHSDVDVVQFMISRKFADFERLRTTLDTKFSGTVFRELPKKSLFVKEGMNHDTRIQLEAFLRQVASLHKLTTSPAFLQFLGASLSGLPVKLESHVDAKTPPSRTPQRCKNIFDDDTDSAGLFDDDIKGGGDLADKDDEILSRIHIQGDTTPTRDVSLFSAQDYGDTIDYDDDLILPSARVTKVTVDEDKVTQQQREQDELLDIRDDLDNFKISKRTKPSRTDRPKKPAVDAPAERSAREDTVESEELTSGDVSQYIQQHLSHSDVDLFS